MTLDPGFVARIRAESARLDEEGLHHSLPRTQAIVRMWASACPKLTKVLKEAGVLDEAANVLDDRVLTQARNTPGEYSEARQQAERALIPHSPETEEEFLSLHTTPECVPAPKMHPT